jgi:hypothetical protein
MPPCSEGRERTQEACVTTIKRPQEIFGERVDECVNAAKDKFETAVRPIYGSNDLARPEHIGSSTLLRINYVPHLLTAAHVVDWNKHTSIYVAGENNLVEIEANFFSTMPTIVMTTTMISHLQKYLGRWQRGWGM